MSKSETNSKHEIGMFETCCLESYGVAELFGGRIRECSIPFTWRHSRLRLAVKRGIGALMRLGVFGEIFERNNGAADGVATGGSETFAGVRARGFDGHSLPGGIAADVVDHGGMAGRDIHTVAFSPMPVGNGLERAGPDTDALVVGQGNEPADAAMPFASDQGNGGTESNGFVLPERGEASRGGVERAAEVVMFGERLPERSLTGDHVEVDSGASRSPGRDVPCGHVENPVGCQPGGDIVVACHGDESALETARPDGLGNGRRTDVRDRAVDDACEFVEDDRVGLGIEQASCEVGTELFTGGEDMIGLEPTWRRSEPHGRECTGDSLDREISEAINDGGAVRPASVLGSELAEEMLRDGGLSACGGADDETDFPIRVEVGAVEVDFAGRQFGNRHIKHAGDLLDAEGIVDRAFEGYGRHGWGNVEWTWWPVWRSLGSVTAIMGLGASAK